MSARVVIEIDGRAHDMGDRPERDLQRDQYLNGLGFAVVRMSAAAVLADFDGAAEAIVAACRAQTSLLGHDGQAL